MANCLAGALRQRFLTAAALRADLASIPSTYGAPGTVAVNRRAWCCACLQPAAQPASDLVTGGRCGGGFSRD